MIQKRFHDQFPRNYVVILSIETRTAGFPVCVTFLENGLETRGELWLNHISAYLDVEA